MSLNQVPIGQTVTILRVEGERSFRRRLLELGLLPGTRVRVLRVAPLGDPLELWLRSAHLSIRANEAEKIFVQEAE